MSASRSLRSMFFGRPLFLLPCGFQVRACGVMLGLGGFRRVCPIHHHLLLLISSSAGSWLVLFHRFLLLMVSNQWICRIFRRQLLMNVWILPVMIFAVLQVPAPYNRTDLTLELKRRSLVQVVIYRDFQMLLGVINAALVFWILVFTSASVPPRCLLIFSVA